MHRSAVRYEATYHDRNGKRHRRLFDLKRDGKRWLEEQTTGLITGQWADPRAGKETFQAYAGRWRTRQVHAPNTQDAFKRILRVHVFPHIGGMRLDAVTTADIQELVRLWTDSAAPTTVEARYTIMATVFRGAVRDRILPASPCLDVRLPRIKRILRVHVFPHIGGMRLDAVTTADIQELVRLWTDSAAPTTVEARYTIMATVFRGAVRDRILPASPCLDVRLPRIEPKSALVPVTTETVLALHDALPPRYRAFVILAPGTGMRRGELLGLTLDRISADFATIRVDRQLARSSTSDRVVFSAPKTQASVRTIGVADLVLNAVAVHVEAYGTHPSGLLFTSEVGFPVGTSVLHRASSIAANQVGSQTTPHDLRHYFAKHPDRRRLLDQEAAAVARPQVRHRDVGHLRAPDRRRG